MIGKKIENLAEELDELTKLRLTGELILCTKQQILGTIQLFSGRLLYVIDEFHPVRRWKRALQQYCPNWLVQPYLSSSNEEFWEYELLHQGINQRKLSVIQVKSVISAIAQECFFELSAYTNLAGEWRPGRNNSSAFSLVVGLSSSEIETILKEAIGMQEQWQAANLTHLKPTFAPILKQKDSVERILVSDNYLNGNFTLWDIAVQMQTSVVAVTSLLTPLEEKNILQFQEIPDLPTSFIEQQAVAIPPRLESKPAQMTPSSTIKLTQSDEYDPNKPLIACIDDSPVLGHSLKKILMSVGYQTLIILEPMEGFAQLMKYKPDLILLDLLMPTANGYSVCKFLRETPLFKNTPIIVLTAKDTLVDRTRAKLVGATDFLSKPPEPQELLQTVRKYLIDIPWQ